MRLTAIALLAAGCFDPTYQRGQSCSESLECPPDQTCIAVQRGIAVCVPSGARGALCNVLDQTGCFGGEKCTNFKGAFVCVSAGDRADGESCKETDDIDDCAPGLVCLSGICDPFCNLDAVSGECPGRTCAYFATGTGVCI